MKKEKIIIDLIYRLEGFRDNPDYEVLSVSRKDGKIHLVLREPVQDERPEETPMIDGE